MVLDTHGGVWVSPSSGAGGEDLSRRCRHSVASVGPYVFIFGGLKGSQLLDDLLVGDDSNGSDLTIIDPRSPAWRQYFEAGPAGERQALLPACACMVCSPPDAALIVMIPARGLYLEMHCQCCGPMQAAAVLP